NLFEGPSRIELRAGSMSIPCMGFHDGKNERGLFIFTGQENSLGDYLFSISENKDRSIAEFSLGSPCVREQYKYHICSMTEPSDDKPITLHPGDSVAIYFSIMAFSAGSMHEFLEKFFSLRSTRHWKYRQKYTVPLSACFRQIEEKFNQQNFVSDYGYYSVGMRENFLQDWQIGWTGGMISTLPLLLAGNKQSRENVLRNFHWLFSSGICPAGFFYDSGEKGNHWYGGDIRKPHTKDWHLIRKSGDGLYYILRQFALMEKMGISVHPEWDSLTKGVANAFVRLWNKWHQFGQFVDSNTGEIRVGGSASGAIVPAALILAYNRYDDPEFLRVAAQSAETFVSKFLMKGFTCGGPGDALQNPDSESSYALLESLVSLYESTKEIRWLDYSEMAAWLFSSWVMAYDFSFPINTTLGKRDATTRGTVIANTQNTHAAPGICTYSGNALLRLFRYTGKTEYLYLLREIVHATPQYLSIPGHSIPGLPPGWMSERINTTDWLEGIGEIMYGSTWAETSLMLQYVEIPGIYINREKSLFIAFDQVEVMPGKNNSLTIRNKTAYACEVTLWEDTTPDKTIPLDLYSSCKKIYLQPYEEKVWR
ncbi:MAG: hypothetical protein ACPLXM_14570, partial [Bacteroidales bacterium]